MITQRAISMICNSLAAQSGVRPAEAVIERDYVLAALLSQLGTLPLREALAFKGGTALRRCWIEDYRFSEDLDFTLTAPLSFPQIRTGFQEVFRAVQGTFGIQLSVDRVDPERHQNSYTFYIRYKGPLPKENDVKVDITIDEHLCFPLMDLPILRTYTAYADIPQANTIRVYTREEIAVEKVVALTDPARTEPRDLYDLWYLLTTTDIELGTLHTALQAKLQHRDRALIGLQECVQRKESTLRSRWASRLSHQMDDLPEFSEVYRSVRRLLRMANIP